MQKYIYQVSTESGHRKLSKQETKVLNYFLKSIKGAEIAKMMNLDEKTVSTYKLRLLQNQFKTIIGLYLFNET
jgi:DNA-binding NarL/FixJ family response regulator